MRNLEHIVSTPTEKKPKKSKSKLKKLLYSTTGFLGLLGIYFNPPHYECGPYYSGPIPRTKKLLEYYSYPKQSVNPKIKETNNFNKYTIKDIEFPSSIHFVKPELIGLLYYEQKAIGKYPTIILLPISGGLEYTISTFADYFASNGFNAAIVRNIKKDKQNRNSEYLENFLRQNAVNNRQVLDFLEKQEKVDKDNFGVFGISLGGINATILSGIDDRINASVLIFSGGSISDIFCYSNEDFIKKPRQELLNQGITLNQMHKDISEKVFTDTLRLAPFIDARNTLMFTAYFDETVPKFTGNNLWESIGKPELFYTLGGHYSSIIYLPIAKKESLKFFKDKLK